MTSIQNLVRKMRPRCPRCSRHIVLNDAVVAIFEAILKELTAKRQVVIPDFGVLRIGYVVGRQIPKHGGGMQYMPGRNVIRFRPSRAAKLKVNANFKGVVHARLAQQAAAKNLTPASTDHGADQRPAAEPGISGTSEPRGDRRIVTRRPSTRRAPRVEDHPGGAESGMEPHADEPPI